MHDTFTGFSEDVKPEVKHRKLRSKLVFYKFEEKVSALSSECR